jgi:hypothetical protein
MVDTADAVQSLVKSAPRRAETRARKRNSSNQEGNGHRTQ